MGNNNRVSKDSPVKLMFVGASFTLLISKGTWPVNERGEEVLSVVCIFKSYFEVVSKSNAAPMC